MEPVEGGRHWCACMHLRWHEDACWLAVNDMASASAQPCTCFWRFSDKYHHEELCENHHMTRFSKSWASNTPSQIQRRGQAQGLCDKRLIWVLVAAGKLWASHASSVIKTPWEFTAQSCHEYLANMAWTDQHWGRVAEMHTVEERKHRLIKKGKTGTISSKHKGHNAMSSFRYPCILLSLCHCLASSPWAILWLVLQRDLKMISAVRQKTCLFCQRWKTHLFWPQRSESCTATTTPHPCSSRIFCSSKSRSWLIFLAWALQSHQQQKHSEASSSVKGEQALELPGPQASLVTQRIYGHVGLFPSMPGNSCCHAYL